MSVFASSFALADEPIRFRDMESHAEVSRRNQIWADWNWPWVQGGLANDSLPSAFDKIEPLLRGVDLDALERKKVRYDSPDTLRYWFGYCHIVAAVSSQYCQPRSGVVSIAGKEVKLTPQEVRRILYFYYDRQNESSFEAFYGEREKMIAPLVLHTQLTTRIGVHHEPLMMTYGSLAEVHNHVIVGYSYEARRESERKYTVELSIEYVPELGRYPGDRVTGVSAGDVKKATLRYEVQLDSRGYIHKARWLEKNSLSLLWTAKKYNFASDSVVPKPIREMLVEATRCE